MNRLLIFGLAIFLFSCSASDETGREDNIPVKINVSEALLYQKDITLSDIADSIAYIRLEPVKDRPIKYIYYFAFFHNDIFINGGTKTGVLHYDGKGKFINTIASAGSGKGQYLPGSDFSINSSSRRIYVLTKFSPRKIMVYDYSGYLFNEFRVTVSAYGGFEAISDNRFLFLAGSSNLGSGYEEYMACIKDREDHTLTKIAHPLPASGELNRVKNIDYQGVISGKYFEGAPIFYDGNSMDTIYSVKNDSIYPRYIIIKEGMPISDTVKSGTGESRKRKNIFIFPSSFTETPRHVFLTFICRDSSYVGAYDKLTKTVSSMKSRFDESDMGNNLPAQFRNDIDGGISVTMGKSNRQGNVWLYIYSSSYFRNRILAAPAGSKPHYPEKQKALRRFATSLPDSEDPVIMAVYLKRTK